TRTGADGTDTLVVPRPAAWHGTWSWAQPEAVEAGATAPSWTTYPLTAADPAAHLPHPTPAVRSGYLQLSQGLVDTGGPTGGPAGDGGHPATP
ncbi:hypothetical protein ACFU6K_32430, partial [Kitasatospora sp. NPDC057512]|uniref:hypothetical protein n=1 Tax=Kitasatospora sp. NPDC057512 TaxID=3346154 RepID=UPI00369F9C57